MADGGFGGAGFKSELPVWTKGGDVCSRLAIAALHLYGLSNMNHLYRDESEVAFPFFRRPELTRDSVTVAEVESPNLGLRDIYIA